MSDLAVDTETAGLDWFDPEHRAFLISWANDAGSDVCRIDDAAGLARFRRAFEAADRIVAHNLSFDCHHIREAIGLDLLTSGKTLIDTDILARVVLPERQSNGAGYKLKNLAKDLLRSDAADAEEVIADLAKSVGIKLKSNGGYYDTWRAYPAEVEHYAKVDTELTLALLHRLEPKLTDRNRQCWDLERRVQPHLIRAEQHGVTVDQSRVEPLVAEYTERAAVAREEVEKALGPDALEGTNALKEALLAHGVPLHRKTKTGEIATDKFALAEFEDSHPVVGALQEWRTAEKFLSTYIGPMVGRDTVHPSFWQCGAWTGRMSCSRPNMQNIPARAGTEVREMFVPRPGHVFVVCDFDSIEVRLLAYYLNNDGYRQIIQEGLDPHAWMASQIWGGVPEDYLKGTAGEKKRGEAKNVLFAIVYGAGGPRVADMLGIPVPEAKALVQTIKLTLPGYMGLAGYKGRVRRKIERDGFVTTLMGRKQTVNKDKSYVGLNALIQGSAADIMKSAIIDVAESVAPLGALPVLFVHDEIVVESPAANAEEVLSLMKQRMAETYPLNPSLAVTGCIAENNYAEAK